MPVCRRKVTVIGAGNVGATAAQRIAEATNRQGDEPECYLVHEIGDGHWYGYLWGPAVAQYVSLVGGPRRIASCLHADTLSELTQILAQEIL